MAQREWRSEVLLARKLGQSINIGARAWRKNQRQNRSIDPTRIANRLSDSFSPEVIQSDSPAFATFPSD